MRRWRSGLVVAALSFVVGSVRLLVTGSTGPLTWVWFVVAAVYACAALVARRLVLPERPEDWLGRRVRTSRLASVLDHHDARPAVRRGSVDRRIRHGGDESVARNRIANALVTVAAVVGMVLVVTGAGQKSDGDDPRDGTPRPGQIAPAVPGQPPPGPAAQSRTSAQGDDG